MNKLTEYFMKRPVLFWSAVAAILIAGVLSFLWMPKLEDPAISAKQAMVVISYPGASAHEVELNAAIRMEDALRALPDVSKSIIPKTRAIFLASLSEYRCPRKL